MNYKKKERERDKDSELVGLCSKVLIGRWFTGSRNQLTSFVTTNWFPISVIFVISEMFQIWNHTANTLPQSFFKNSIILRRFIWRIYCMRQQFVLFIAGQCPLVNLHHDLFNRLPTQRHLVSCAAVMNKLLPTLMNRLYVACFHPSGVSVQSTITGHMVVAYLVFLVFVFYENAQLLPFVAITFYISTRNVPTTPFLLVLSSTCVNIFCVSHSDRYAVITPFGFNFYYSSG